MRIYTRVVIDMLSGSVDEVDMMEYEGPVDLCKGEVHIPPMPPPPKPPPLPPPPEAPQVEQRKRSEYLDQLLLRMKKAQAFKFPGSNAMGLGGHQGAAAAQGLQPKTLLGE